MSNSGHAFFCTPKFLHLCIMRIDIISVVPELLQSPFEASILKRAIEANLVDVHVHNFPN